MAEYLEALSTWETAYLFAALAGGMIFLIWTVWQVAVEAFKQQRAVTEAPTEFQVGWITRGLVGFILLFGVVGLALTRLMGAGVGWSLAGALAAGGGVFGAVWVLEKVAPGTRAK